MRVRAKRGTRDTSRDRAQEQTSMTSIVHRREHSVSALSRACAPCLVWILATRNWPYRSSGSLPLRNYPSNDENRSRFSINDLILRRSFAYTLNGHTCVEHYVRKRKQHPDTDAYACNVTDRCRTSSRSNGRNWRCRLCWRACQPPGSIPSLSLTRMCRLVTVIQFPLRLIGKNEIC